MDVGAVSSAALAPDATQSEISIRVAREALDAAKAQGDAAVSLLQSAVQMSKQEAQGHATSPGSLDVMA
jgi:hypothetical protein